MRFRWVFRLIATVGLLAGLALTTGALVAGQFGGLVLDGDYLPFLAYMLAGVFAFSRRPDHPVARRLLVTGAALLLALTIGRLASYVANASSASDWFWIANTLEQVVELAAFAALVSLFTVFPDGAYERGYERVAVWFACAAVVVVPVLELVALPVLHVNDNEFAFDPVVASPLFVPSLDALGKLALGAFDGRIALIPLAAALLAVRYLRMSPDRQSQAKWPLLAVLAFGIIGVGPLRALIDLAEDWGALPAISHTVAYQLTNALVPVALVIGLLRYRLLDVELVVRKSLVFGILWLAIALAYVGASAALGLVVGDHLPVGVVVGCTIVAALVFQPARTWLESLADRWVFGERASGSALVSQFGSVLEQVVQPSELATRLVSTVRRGLRVRWSRVVFGDEVVADGIAPDDQASPALSAPLVYETQSIGAIECGPRLDGTPLSARDEQLLVTLSRQAALGLRNARLNMALEEQLERLQHQARELAASRARIIQAEDAARQRIERDLHDGVQQELVALLAKIGLARNQITRDAASAVQLLAELQEDAKQAIHDLRELVHGIHSTVLSDRGILEAVEARVARLPLTVSIESHGLARGMRVNGDVEIATYFVVCESLANTLKHADAEHVSVRFTRCPHELVVEVCDDGRGMDPAPARWSGLQGLADRVEALGGVLTVSSCDGPGGTRVMARLPIGESQGA